MAVTVHDSAAPPSPASSTAATTGSTAPPRNMPRNTGVTIARSTAWKAPTNVRSSTRRSPGITAME